MIEPLNSVWETEDMPVLIAAAYLLNEHGRSIRDKLIPEVAQVDIQTVWRSLRRLDGEYLEVSIPAQRRQGQEIMFVSRMTPKGLRASGLWPSASSIEESLLAEVQRFAEHGSPQQSSAAEKLRSALLDFSIKAGVGEMGHLVQLAMHML